MKILYLKTANEQKPLDCPSMTAMKRAKTVKKQPKEAKKAPGPTQALNDELLAEVVNRITTLRDAGKQYQQIFPEVAHFWSDESRPKGPNNLAKFVSMLADSPRAPAGFKEWYANRKRLTRGLEPRSPAAPKEQKLISNKPEKSREELVEKSLIKAQLRELFASGRQLVKLGAMDTDAVLDMALKYLDRL